MIAHITGLKPGGIFHTIGDAHIYGDHVEQVYKQLSRKPYPSPKCFILEKADKIEDFNINILILLIINPILQFRAKMSV